MRFTGAHLLSALRLCVRLFDNGDIKFCGIDESFVFALRTVQGEVYQYRLIGYAVACLAAADRAVYEYGAFHHVTSAGGFTRDAFRSRRSRLSRKYISSLSSNPLQMI